jgi:antibiotic biosynthesis monooxygenase (ABM) superfamily enzyme
MSKLPPTSYILAAIAVLMLYSAVPVADRMVRTWVRTRAAELRLVKVPKPPSPPSPPPVKIYRLAI